MRVLTDAERTPEFRAIFDDLFGRGAWDEMAADQPVAQIELLHRHRSWWRDRARIEGSLYKVGGGVHGQGRAPSKPPPPARQPHPISGHDILPPPGSSSLRGAMSGGDIVDQAEALVRKRVAEIARSDDPVWVTRPDGSATFTGGGKRIEIPREVVAHLRSTHGDGFGTSGFGTSM